MRIRTGRTTAPIALCAVTLLLTALTGCDSPSSAPAPPTASDKNGDEAPGADRTAAPSSPVPRGEGSRVPFDFNGDGHRDLVLDDLVKSPRDRHGDDAGIGVVYGTGTDRRLDPAVRQLLTPQTHAAKVRGVLPAAFDAETSCDLDEDGFADLVVATDPPYDGRGRPPVPLQLLFGSPAGIDGRAVVLRIPARARYGDDWPASPVCGDYDGDGGTDLVVTASDGRMSFLRGPFTRDGAPHAAGAPVPGGGAALEAPVPAADTNGDGADDLVVLPRPRAAGAAAEGRLLLGGPTGPGLPGGTYAFGTAAPPPAAELPAGTAKPVTDVLTHADFDGDRRPDLVTRTHRGEQTDVIALHPGGADARPLITFTTALFLP